VRVKNNFFREKNEHLQNIFFGDHVSGGDDREWEVGEEGPNDGSPAKVSVHGAYLSFYATYIILCSGRISVPQKMQGHKNRVDRVISHLQGTPSLVYTLDEEGSLTAEQRRSYEKNGFIVFRKLLGAWINVLHVCGVEFFEMGGEAEVWIWFIHRFHNTLPLLEEGEETGGNQRKRLTHTAVGLGPPWSWNQVDSPILLAPFVLSTVHSLRFMFFFNIFEFLRVFTGLPLQPHHLAILATTGQRLLSNRGTYPYTTHNIHTHTHAYPYTTHPPKSRGNPCSLLRHTHTTP